MNAKTTYSDDEYREMYREFYAHAVAITPLPYATDVLPREQESGPWADYHRAVALIVYRELFEAGYQQALKDEGY